MPNTKTRYGNIDKDALENLQEGDFDLQKFHKALDVLQNLRGDLSLPELAETLSYQAMEYSQAFETIWDSLSELEDLQPDPDEEEEEAA